MRKVLAIGLAAFFLIMAFAQWRSHAVGPMHPVSASQIFIHGTPVCVFQNGVDIMARVGPCPETQGEENDSLAEPLPDHVGPGMNLPPGHPPVDDELPFDDKRPVLI